MRDPRMSPQNTQQNTHRKDGPREPLSLPAQTGALMSFPFSAQTRQFCVWAGQIDRDASLTEPQKQRCILGIAAVLLPDPDRLPKD